MVCTVRGEGSKPESKRDTARQRASVREGQEEDAQEAQGELVQGFSWISVRKA